MTYLTQSSSNNRLDATSESKILVNQVYADVTQLTGLPVNQYYQYYIEEAIAKIDQNDLKLKLDLYLEYLNSFDNDNTHIDVLWAVQHSFTPFSIVNKQINKVCKSLITRYNNLREMQQEIENAENKVAKLKYFQNNWKALTTNDPNEFVKLLKITNDHFLIYEKFLQLNVEDNITNTFFGIKNKIEDTPEVNKLIDTITPFAIAIANVDPGMACTTLLNIGQFQSIPKGKELYDKIIAIKNEKLKDII